MTNSNYNLDNREWWVERWLELLDSYRFKKRLERARMYAREGNVLSIDFQGSQVLAQVQGSDDQPYQVSLSLDPFSKEDWVHVIESMSHKAIFSAQLLAGEMPANIEEVFTANGLSLFPFSLSDIRSRCSCPDQANLCKHIGAVYYQLGDRFSEDPFVLFKLRGRTKKQILDALRQNRSRGNKQTGTFNQGKLELKVTNKGKGAITHHKTKKSLETEELSKFWEYKEPLDPSLVVIVPPTESKTILDILGKMPLAYSDAQLAQHSLNQAYQVASQKAIAAAMN